MILMVAVVSVAVAQRPNRKAEPVTVSNNRSASTELVLKKKDIGENAKIGRDNVTTGAQRHFVYTIESLDVDESEVIDVNILVTVNPSNNKLTVKVTPSESGMLYELFDGTQACLEHKPLRGQNTNISFSRYHEGEYVLKVQNVEGKYSKFKIVKTINN